MEVLMVIFALLIGIAFGMVVRYFMDNKYIDEINELYEKDKSYLKRTMQMREHMHINTVNRLHQLILERDKTINEYDKAKYNAHVAPDVAEMSVEEKKKIIGTKEWFNALTDVSEPLPDDDDDVKYGGF
jgi:hypothetical protein